MVKLRDTVSQHLVTKNEPKKLIPMLRGDDEEEVTAVLRKFLDSKLADDETGEEASAAPEESGADINKPAATGEKTAAEAPAEPKKKKGTVSVSEQISSKLFG
jgi:hypothetical protein